MIVLAVRFTSNPKKGDRMPTASSLRTCRAAFVALTLLIASAVLQQANAQVLPDSVRQTEVKTIDGKPLKLADYTGKVWRWDGSGNPEALPTSLPLDHVSW